MRRLPARPMAMTALVMSAVAWGSTVVVTKTALAGLDALAVTALRLLLTGLCLGGVFFSKLAMPRGDIVRGALLGFVLASGLLAQTLGLRLVAPSTSGFLTATYVIFTAVLAFLWLRQRQPPSTWLAAVVAVAGIAVLAGGGETTSVNAALGAVLTLTGAVCYAVHIVFLGRVVRRDNVAGLTAVQALAGAAAGFVLWLVAGAQLPSRPMLWAQLLYLGVVCGAVALLLQGWGQSHIAAAPAAVVMCTEPAWGAVFSVAAGLEPVTSTMLLGVAWSWPR